MKARVKAKAFVKLPGSKKEGLVPFLCRDISLVSYYLPLSPSLQQHSRDQVFYVCSLREMLEPCFQHVASVT